MMQVFEAKTLDEIYPELCQAVLDEGEENFPRGIGTWDLGPTTILISNPRRRILTNKVRRINPYFLFAEFIWIATRSNRADMIGFYNKHMWDFSDDGKQLFGAYGPRIMYQIPGIINKINQDKNTRQAVATIFKPRDQLVPTKDFPCNILLHFIPRKDQLNLITYVRSQDVLLGLPYDFYHWSFLLEMIANETNLEVGTVTHICGSLHGYHNRQSNLYAVANSSDSDILDWTEPKIRTKINHIKTISTIEYTNRKNRIDSYGFEKSLNYIRNINEDINIQNQLALLLYYKIRNQEIDLDKEDCLRLTGYSEVVNFMDWQ